MVKKLITFFIHKVTKSINIKILRDIPKILLSLGMCEVSYKPHVSIGFMYTVILDGRIVGYVPETLTELFIKKLRTLKVQGKQVIILIHTHINIFRYQMHG